MRGERMGRHISADTCRTVTIVITVISIIIIVVAAAVVTNSISSDARGSSGARSLSDARARL